MVTKVLAKSKGGTAGLGTNFPLVCAGGRNGGRNGGPLSLLSDIGTGNIFLEVMNEHTRRPGNICRSYGAGEGR